MGIEIEIKPMNVQKIIPVTDFKTAYGAHNTKQDDDLAKKESVGCSAQSKSGTRVRARYLTRLGIAPKIQSTKVSPLHQSRPRQSAVQMPLKGNDGEPCPKRKPRSISFDDSVSVVPIPTRKEYSTRIKKHLWGDRSEMNANVQRNMIEFSAEGWRWQSVMEEDAMIVADNGDRIHPIHIYNQMRGSGVQRRFLTFMSNRGVNSV